MNLSQIKNSRYIKGLNKDKKFIMIVTAIVLAWGGTYLTAFYQPKYVSNAKVLIKDLSTQGFVTQYDSESEIKPLIGNPISNQLEILQSQQLNKALVERMIKEYPNLSNKNEAVSFPALKAKSLVGTDIIEISLEGKDIKTAQNLLNLALEEYEKLNLNLNKKIRTQRKLYIDEQTEKIYLKLKTVRAKIKNYKSKHLAVDLINESGELVRQKVAFSTQLENINASIKDSSARKRELQNKLRLDVKGALDAVALGKDNENLINLRQNLNDSNQQYYFDSIKYAPTSPKLVAIKSKIEAIENQMQQQATLTTGKGMNKKGINIFDGVRSGLVADMAGYQTSYIGYSAQKKSLLSSIKKINKDLLMLPVKKFNLDNLEQEERNLSTAYDSLRVKQIEAGIKEAETVSNLSIINYPSIPLGKSFPTPFHILFLSLIFGGMLGVTLSAIKTNIEDVCEGPSCIEEITGKAVIGIIPWLESSLKLTNQSIIDFSFKNIVTSLILKCYTKSAKVLLFVSTSSKKSGSGSIYAIANNLKKMGHSVIVVDADFKAPTLYKDAKVIEKAGFNLTDLILNLEKGIKSGLNIQGSDVLNFVQEDSSGIKLLGNHVSIDADYEYLGTSSMKSIISILKENFDWVLIDTAPAHLSPAFPIISKLCDGVVLFANYKVTYSILSRISTLLNNFSIPLIGTIVREQNSVIENDYNEMEIRNSNCSNSLEETK